MNSTEEKGKERVEPINPTNHKSVVSKNSNETYSSFKDQSQMIEKISQKYGTTIQIPERGQLSETATPARNDEMVKRINSMKKESSLTKSG